MPKKEKKEESNGSSVMEMIKTGFSTLSEVLFSNVFGKIKDMADGLMDTVEARTLILEEKLIKKVAASLIIGIAFLFFVFAGLFYLIEFRGISKAEAFLYLGIVLLVIGIFLKYKNLREERGE